jgi:hypothetical protein
MNQQVFDSHLHIIDPAFPLVPNKGYLISLLVDALGEEGAELALWMNAASFYRIPA